MSSALFAILACFLIRVGALNIIVKTSLSQTSPSMELKVIFSLNLTGIMFLLVDGIFIALTKYAEGPWGLLYYPILLSAVQTCSTGVEWRAQLRSTLTLQIQMHQHCLLKRPLTLHLSTRGGTCNC